MHEHHQEESTIDILIVYWPINNLKTWAPYSAFPSASLAQRGISSSWLCWVWWDHHDFHGLWRVICLRRRAGEDHRWFPKDLKRRGEERWAKGLTWYHLCTTRNQVWALLTPHTGVRLVVLWPLHCSWTLWWWEGLQEGNTWSHHTLPCGIKHWYYARAGFSCKPSGPVEAHSSRLQWQMLPLLLWRIPALWTVSNTPR